MSHAEHAARFGAPGRRWLMLVFWLAVVAAVGWAGSWITLPKIPTWYAGLVKPWFTPPNALIGPVWSVLYVLMAVAAWRIGETVAARERRRAMILFVVQLALNALWSPVFFGLEAPAAGLAVIVLLLAALIVTLCAAWRVDRVACLLLVPYLVWVAYATVLNAAIVALGRVSAMSVSWGICATKFS